MAEIHQNPVSVVTGGARRLGRECCLRLAELGYDVAIVFNNSADDAEELAGLIRAKGRLAAAVRCDLRDVGRCESLLSEVRELLGVPTVLVNNASIFERGTLRETTAEELDANFAVHVRAPFILTREFAKMATGGLVVNMLDMRISKTRTAYFAYLLSKKSLFEMTRLAAAELAPEIRVNAIAPGFILPSENASAISAENLVRRRQGSPEDVTAALEFFLKNDFVTGDTVFIDGGERL